jgi:hypothetical protein
MKMIIPGLIFSIAVSGETTADSQLSQETFILGSLQGFIP